MPWESRRAGGDQFWGRQDGAEAFVEVVVSEQGSKGCIGVLQSMVGKASRFMEQSEPTRRGMKDTGLSGARGRRGWKSPEANWERSAFSTLVCSSPYSGESGKGNCP